MLARAAAVGENFVADQPTKHPILTDREYEILKHVAGGCTNAEVAGRLGISTYTVRNHMANIFEKLDAESRFHAVELVFGHPLAKGK